MKNKQMIFLICLLWCIAGLTSCTADLLTAVNSGNLAEVEMASSRGSNINKRDSFGNTPLIVAAKYGDLAIVQTLIKKGADIKAKNKDGYDALLALSNYTMRGAPVAGKGGQPSEPIAIATDGHLKVAEYLIDQGAEVNTKTPDGNTALILAVRLYKAKLADILMNKGTDVNAANQQGKTALIIAVSMGYKDIVCPLLRKGADKNAKDQAGLTALQYAEKHNSQEIAQLLQTPCPAESKLATNEGSDSSIKPRGEAVAAEKLIEALKDPDPAVRSDSARRLGGIKEKRAVIPLIDALKDEHVYVRRRAAFSLGEMRDLRAVEALIKALSDEDSFVKKYAQEALEKTTGKQFGNDSKKWQEWWNQTLRQQ